MSPIRILQVFDGMNRGGAESMIMNLYRKMDRSRIQFDFLVHVDIPCDFDEEIQELGGHIYHAPPYRIINHIAYCRWLNRFFNTHSEYHIIHGHQYSTASVYLSVAKRHGLVTIAHSHSTSNGNGLFAVVKTVLQRPLWHITDYRFACSQDAGEWLYRKKAFFEVLPNAIDIDLYRFSAECRAKMRLLLGISDDILVIGHVGRFSVVKNHTKLVEIFASINATHPKSLLLLVGDGPLRTDIEDKVRKLNLVDSVRFMGVRNDVADLLQAMDVFVFPSLYEGLPVTVVEAQAAGLPCILADSVTQQVCMTDLVTFQSLDASIDMWKDDIQKTSNLIRRDTQADIRRAGYDIRESAKRLTEFYQKI